MPLFRRSKGKGYIPIEEVQRMRERGLSDREITNELKRRGFSFEEIERALLQTLKSAVGTSQAPKGTEIPRTPPPEEKRTMTIEDIYASEGEEAPVETPESDVLALPTEELQPEVTIEELVEGVVNEKWEAFEREMKELREEQSSLMRGLKELEAKLAELGSEREEGEVKRKLDELESKFADLEARINALEKAFKQFLPSLVENVRELTNLIGELKGKS